MNLRASRQGWVIVFSAEARQLWLGWKGPLILFAFSVFLSVFTLLLSLDPEINVLSQRGLINLTLQTSVLLGIMAAVLLGANSFSGERDQRSLESLLLTPVPRGQIAIGKWLAACSLWLGMAPISVPYVALVAKGSGLALDAILLLIIPGTLLVLLTAGLSVLISGLSPTNLISFTASALLIILLAAPSQLPTKVQEHPIVHYLMVANPLTASAMLQGAVIEGEAWTSLWDVIISLLVALFLVLVLGAIYLNKNLSLEGGLRR